MLQKRFMLGYMNHDSLNRTIKTKKVTFFSRSRNSIWVKGETSGNFLNLVDISLDCDKDALLIKVIPKGPVCTKDQILVGLRIINLHMDFYQF